jgi:3-hydroxybutyrate dehydrogenase
MGKLSGKVAVVTGACSGIGRAIAELYAQEGAAVGIVDLDSGKIDGIARELERHGVKTAAAEADVADEVAIKAALQGSSTRSGRSISLSTTPAWTQLAKSRACRPTCGTE